VAGKQKTVFTGRLADMRPSCDLELLSPSVLLPLKGWAMYQVNHAISMLMSWVEHFQPKHWLGMLLLMVAFGYLCMRGLGSRVGQ